MAQRHKRKCVVVNADDFGFSEGVTEGILRAHDEGIVTSTTITANLPAAAPAVARLKDAPGLGVGVHLNVSQGPPLSPAGRALADEDGVMRSTAAAVLAGCVLHPRRLDAIEAECDAQIRWVLDHGIRPTHLDSHRHIHAFTPVFLRVARLARRYDIRFVRWHREVLPGPPWPVRADKQRWVAVLCNVFGLCNAHAATGVRHADATWGIAHTGRIDEPWLIRAARSVRPGVTEIMTHPGAGEDLDPGETRLLASRAAEREALCAPAVREAFRQSGIELIHYGQL